MEAIVLKADRLIDGTGSPPVEQPTVLVRGGRIDAVFTGRLPTDAVPDAAHILEYPGGTLLPGLIDCHVHLNLPGDGTPFATSVAEPDGVLVATSAHNARVALDAGITTLRDCGGRGTTTFELRRALQYGYGTGSRLVLCGSPITITGGHCWYFGAEADGVDGVRHMVREMAKRGADFIKVMGTGGGTPGTLPWLPAYRHEEIAALADEAHRQNRTISIHCLCADAIAMAVDAGVDHIEHAWFLVDAAGNIQFSPPVAERLARSGAFVSGTLAVGRYTIATRLAQEPRTAAAEAELVSWQAMQQANLENFRRLLDAGVTFVAGTDAGWRFTPFNSLVDELELMHEGGMTPAEAVHAATGRAARALGLEEETGVIRPGLAADIIVVEGDPLQQLDALRRPRLIMQAGRLHAS